MIYTYIFNNFEIILEICMLRLWELPFYHFLLAAYFIQMFDITS